MLICIPYHSIDTYCLFWLPTRHIISTWPQPTTEERDQVRLSRSPPTPIPQVGWYKCSIYQTATIPEFFLNFSTIIISFNIHLQHYTCFALSLHNHLSHLLIILSIKYILSNKLGIFSSKLYFYLYLHSSMFPDSIVIQLANHTNYSTKYRTD